MSRNPPQKVISRTQPSSHHKSKNNKSASAAPIPNQSFSAAAASGTTNSVQWLDLPKQLLYLMSTEKPMLFQDVSSRCVTKSWKPHQLPKSKCCKSNPQPTLQQLQLSQHHHPYRTSTTFPHSISTFPTSSNIKGGSVRWVGMKYERAQNKYTRLLIGFSKGMVSRQRNPMSESHIRYELLNSPVDYCSSWGVRPPWEADQPFPRPLRYSCLQPRLMMLLTGLPVPAFAYYRIGLQWDHSWKKHDSAIVDPNGGYMSLCNGVWLRRKLYALSLQGSVVVIEEDNSGDGFRIGEVGKNGRAVPRVPFKQFSECLVESGGEIVLVFLIFRRSTEKVDGVEVYSLDVGTLEWVPRQSLGGDRALFVGTNCCVSVDHPWEVGVSCRRNCVYFKANYFEEWSEYDMETGCVLPFPSLVSGIDCS
ncbi:hypothetical protein LINPERPRIM_LOCUS35765 [Linum perenne]